MEKKRLKVVVQNLIDRIDMELGINPMTNEEGIKINGIPNEYDLEFIENNREDIIVILKEIEEENNIEKIDIKLKIKKEDFAKLREEAINEKLTVEQVIMKKLNLKD